MKSSAYIVVSSESRSLKKGDFSLYGRSSIRVFEILGCLSIRGRYGWAVGFLCVKRKMFPYMSIREDQARPRRTHRLLHSVSLKLSVFQGSPIYSWGRCVRRLLRWNRPLKALLVLKVASPPLSSFWSLHQFLWSWQPGGCRQLS